ncbi:hypothetical protein FGB62_55g133 [Gracilaria domingensis]|nr:hypothetical protein FGB62_55g133 [Gracilaria domingensis]
MKSLVKSLAVKSELNGGTSSKCMPATGARRKRRISVELGEGYELEVGVARDERSANKVESAGEESDLDKEKGCERRGNYGVKTKTETIVM